jgi:hypothetical protein
MEEPPRPEGGPISLERARRSKAAKVDEGYTLERTVVAEGLYADLRKAALDLLAYLEKSGWTLGHWDQHRETERPDLATMQKVKECSCGDPWPCAYVRLSHKVS